MRYPIGLTLALSALVFTGCGGGVTEMQREEDDPPTLVEASAYPSCSDIWVVGQVIPEDYEGCMDGDALHAAVSWECNDGTAMVGFEDEGLFGLIGGEVQAGDSESAEYSAAFDECLGPF